MIFILAVPSRITLYFDSELLYNRTFYISTVHSAYPNDLGEWKNSNKMEYKRKYKKIIYIMIKYY
jgi:hypothetical protein